MDSIEKRYGLTLQSLIPVRAEASERAEMTTQLLFGEWVLILEETEKWLQIKSMHDGYVGWIDAKMLRCLTKTDPSSFLNQPGIIKNPLAEIEWDNGQSQLIPAGSWWYPELPDEIGLKARLKQPEVIANRFNETDKIKIALQLLNAPYLWGGRTVMGIDCSGFSQLVYRICGIQLLRDASQQAGQGILIPLLQQAQAGDLAFFDNAEGKIIHVGMLMSSSQIIHASGKVRIDSIDHQGIFNSELNRYTHNLRLIKRIV